MPMGRRARFSGRGRERAWWLLAAAVLVAVLGALAQLLAWPLQVWLALTGLAAAAALVVPELRARFKQDDTRAALVTKAVAVPSRQNRLPLVREAGLTQLRVHSRSGAGALCGAGRPTASCCSPRLGSGRAAGGPLDGGKDPASSTGHASAVPRCPTAHPGVRQGTAGTGGRGAGSGRGGAVAG